MEKRKLMWLSREDGMIFEKPSPLAHEMDQRAYQYKEDKKKNCLRRLFKL